MTTALPLVANKIAVSHSGKTVLIELICPDEYATIVLYDDVISRLSSGESVSLLMLCPKNSEADA